MQVFERVISEAIPLDMDNVDTDMIIPAQFLVKINREGYGEHLFQRLREQDADFVFNDPRYKSSEILVTRANFGCGSSREHAVWSLMQAGIRVIIAESYSDIFYNNAAKNGLLTINLAPAIIAKLIGKIKLASTTLTVDLAMQTITTMDDEIHFDYDPFRKECLLKGQEDLDYLLEATR
jgi:3-isopropylmalate/(R)-2-methylmalate dehydratase small subunit